ncbi:hypothetical protein FLCU109888_11260 [Flavobacterium cucumis]|uniref:Uncharacterized protein n=1 Tax=Flavobacterium cucumis TaxID=416016 RepID=A0A1M7ZZJ6_9FLAO|nr:hypothetical protein [Flavobacterium cucumis]SHO74284.1 hypothetical protein SAMN05443547_2674 [Flavobacterium cucumis]
MKPIDLENNKKIASGFKVPDHYFDKFEATLMEEILKEQGSKVVPLCSRKKIWISTLAAVLLLSIGFTTYWNNAQENKIDAVTIENYLAQQRISTSELTKHLTNDDIEALEENLYPNEAYLEAIEDHLLESENLEYHSNEF